MSESDVNLYLEYIENPSKFSKSMMLKFIEINRRYEGIFNEKNKIKKMINLVKISSWNTTKFIEHYELLKKFDKIYHLESYSLNRLKKEFLNFYSNAILNNLLLAFNMQNFPGKFTLIIKEEDKNMMLKELDKENHEDFIKKFGHYALNRFEVKEKRFSEFSFQELKGVSNKLDEYEIPRHKKRFNEELIDRYDKVDIYFYLREEFTYYALKFISEIRKKGLDISTDYFDKEGF